MYVTMLVAILVYRPSTNSCPSSCLLACKKRQMSIVFNSHLLEITHEVVRDFANSGERGLFCNISNLDDDDGTAAVRPTFARKCCLL